MLNLDNLLFVIFPYAVIVLALVVTAQRYFTKAFTYSSLSSQFLESGELFYGSVPWHIGVLGVLTGHLIGFLFPRSVLAFNSVPLRLYILESTALLFGLMCLVGIVNLIIRRHVSARIRAVTSLMDVVVLILLLIQVALGVYTAIFYRWGSSWYATSVVPYLWSLLTLRADVAMIAPLPLTIKLHFLNAWVLVAVFGFSRLVHMLVVPLHYLWRPYQLVIWNWNSKRLRGQAPRPRPAPAEVMVPASEPVPRERPAFTR
ncbi:MAG TPA: respiratory nitrate reductase subunit gamma [Blastocatellia bacterium]|nr:respiratory nitrate reductase subunit gamma [Blastocatellia bacterium]